MPIRMPRAGKIHLGVKTKNLRGTEYPKAVDYFVVRPGETTSEAASEAFKKVYGEKPKTIDIVFPTEEMERICSIYYKCYSGRKNGGMLMCKGSQGSATRVMKDGQMKEVSCPEPENCIYAGEEGKKKCRRITSLQFMMPEVQELGVWQIDTSSFYGAQDIVSMIAFIKMVAGSIRFLPLKLSVEPKQINHEGKLTTIYHLKLTSDKGPNELKAIAAEIRRIEKEEGIQNCEVPTITQDKPEDLYVEQEDKPSIADTIMDTIPEGTEMHITAEAPYVAEPEPAIQATFNKSQPILAEVKVVPEPINKKPGSKLLTDAILKLGHQKGYGMEDLEALVGPAENEAEIIDALNGCPDVNIPSMPDDINSLFEQLSKPPYNWTQMKQNMIRNAYKKEEKLIEVLKNGLKANK